MRAVVVYSRASRLFREDHPSVRQRLCSLVPPMSCHPRPGISPSNDRIRQLPSNPLFVLVMLPRYGLAARDARRVPKYLPYAPTARDRLTALEMATQLCEEPPSRETDKYVYLRANERSPCIGILKLLYVSKHRLLFGCTVNK